MPTTENEVDISALARVASNVDLSEIRVFRLEASRGPMQKGPLEPQIHYESSGQRVAPNQLNVVCIYYFRVQCEGVEVVKIDVGYLMMYELLGEVSEDDIKHFSAANGLYHSWPFLRQLLFDLTSKMGFPPLTLPVFQAIPRGKPQKVKDAPAKSEAKKPRAALRKRQTA